MAMKSFMEPSAAEMICDDPFDSIDDLLDFPNDDDVLAVVEACGGSGDDGAPLALPQAPAISSAGSGGGVNAGAADRELHDRPASISGEFKQENDALDLCNDIDIANLEWLSNFFEDSELINFDFPATPAAGASIKIPNNRDDDSLFRSSSPISVLEPNSLSGGTTTTVGSGGAYSSSTTSSCSSSSNSIREHSMISTGQPPAPIDMPIVPARARTKRPRRPSFSARSFVPPPSSEYPPAISYPARPAEPESVGESYGPVAMKKKKKKAVVTESGEEKWFEGAAAPPVRKCMHCEIQRTPQWRAGPMGPKTLCNACGVRYKSGRLFPEYRPAASPTFVPSFHSNSHKKVVEMRLNFNQTAGSNVGMRPQEGTVAAKNCDLLKYLRGQDRDN